MTMGQGALPKTVSALPVALGFLLVVRSRGGCGVGGPSAV